MNIENPLYKSLEETYFQGEYVYNYGSFAPPFPIPSQSNTPTPTPSPSFTPSVSITPSVSKTPSPSLTPSISVSTTPGVSTTPTPSLTPTISVSSSPTPSGTPFPSITPTISITPTLSPTTTPTISLTPSISPSPQVPLPESMTIVGTGSFSGFSGTWKASQLFNKALYSRQGSGTYFYNKFKLAGATAMVFYKTTAQQYLFWVPVSNNVLPCYNIGAWNFYRTFSHYPTYPVETFIGTYSATAPQYFCSPVNSINGLGFPPEGTITHGYGSVSITYNYPA